MFNPILTQHPKANLKPKCNRKPDSADLFINPRIYNFLPTPPEKKNQLRLIFNIINP